MLNLLHIKCFVSKCGVYHILVHDTSTEPIGGATIVYCTHIFDHLDGWPTHLLRLSKGQVSLQFVIQCRFFRWKKHFQIGKRREKDLEPTVEAFTYILPKIEKGLIIEFDMSTKLKWIHDWIISNVRGNLYAFLRAVAIDCNEQATLGCSST